MKDTKVTVVIPAYNEEENIETLVRKIDEVLKNKFFYKILFIDDGSTDKTLNEIQKLSKKHGNINYIALSRNFGQQCALKAGIDHATGDCVISMDADLQHPPKIILEMIKKWKEGYEIIYTKRDNNSNMPIFKRIISNIFYKLIGIIGDINIENGTADFRLLDKKVVKVIKDINESALFLRGLVSWCGFRQACIKYKPDKRYAGTTKYSFKKMILLALDGITSFSIKPLRIATVAGLILSMFSSLYAFYAIMMHFFNNRTISGWTSIIISVLFMGGIQLLILGIIGEYLGKLFFESKKRPLYIVKAMKL